MSKPRDTYKYEFKLGNKAFHSGITNGPNRRDDEHRRYPAGGAYGERTSSGRWQDPQARENPPPADTQPAPEPSQ